MGKTISINFWILVAIILSLAMVVALPSSLPEGAIYKPGGGDTLLTVPSLVISSIPPAIVEVAKTIGKDLYGNHLDEYDKFVNQLLAMYLEVKDKDFAIVFNPGGWGWASLDASPGWSSISGGISKQLLSMGYTSTILDYQRTRKTVNGAMDEFVSMLSFKKERTEDLVYKIDFLTMYVPDLRIILAGESNGTVYSDHVMTVLKNNPNVFSIQTGPPFWHRYVTLNRTLLLRNNGETNDSFSQGDLLRVLWANLRHWFGFPTGDNGTIAYSFQAPGHYYSWDTKIAAQVTDFLKENFGTNS